MAEGLASFSVIIPTLGRTHELGAFLRSLEGSTLRPQQIIVVDQNSDDRIAPVIAEFPALGIDHQRVAFRGLSAARNHGARAATSDIVFIPDDDCTVLPATFQTALEEMSRTGADAVFGKCLDENGADSVTPHRNNSGWLSRTQMDGMFVEATTAVRASVLREIPFDETLGLGTFHGAEEGYDWVLRLLSAKKRLFFQPAITFIHPRPISDHGSPAAVRRAFTYRSGYGRLCRKHGLWGKYSKRVALVVAGIVVYSVVDRKKARYYLAELAGLIAGATVDP
jgi:glycosyltransferase involved in cell wall biosynthesis